MVATFVLSLGITSYSVQGLTRSTASRLVPFGSCGNSSSVRDSMTNVSGVVLAFQRSQLWT
jgi:hypothetical protein